MKAKKTLIGLAMLLLAWTLQSQSITFILDSIPDYTPAEDIIYLSSNLNNWKIGDPEYALHKNSEDNWEITVDKPDGYPWNSFYYYFTRGSHKTMVRDSVDLANGPSPQIFFTENDTISVRILNWYDNPNKPSTSSWNVSRISEDFPIPQLDRTRGISIYLPPDYNNSEESYPVIYLNDGQEAFDLYKAYNYEPDEWGIDEVLNEMASEGITVPIVVAIDHNGDKRLDELSPWLYTHSRFWGSPILGGEGDEYIDFITNTLKPYIDSTYRTLSDPDNTCIMGSSLGGLISIYGALKRPDVFRKAGLFSPAYEVSDSVWDFVRDIDKVHPMRLYQLVGKEETWAYINNVRKMDRELSDLGFFEDEIKYKIVEGGEHHKFVGTELRETYLWLFPEAVSSKEPILSNPDITVYPNPVSKTLYLDSSLPLDNSEVTIYTMTGAVVKNELIISSNQISIADLPKGMYILKISGTDINYQGRFVKE